MQNDKNQPSHKITFSEKHQDNSGRDQLGAPVEVATVWPRKGDKQGGIIQWHISPDKLNNGVFFMLDNNRKQEHGNYKNDSGDRNRPQQDRERGCEGRQNDGFERTNNRPQDNGRAR